MVNEKERETGITFFLNRNFFILHISFTTSQVYFDRHATIFVSLIGKD